ncbi:protein MEI2-like 2 isoform X2 [Canna indica]|uniref:Protein MEI2-like 2 isoform X2 n=1 Tax=Canna indica TaxID=4628 RepID=A0AAQ3QID6_9LILI|nr:protein MEI2-like 2 isoform X2 [Canna indica]
MEQYTDNSIPEGRSGISLMKMAQIAGTNLWEVPSGSKVFNESSYASLFSSSLPVLRHDKTGTLHSAGDSTTKLRALSKDGEGKFSVDDLDLQGAGISLPDDEEELLAGIVDDFEFRNMPKQVEESDDYDLFGSVGGFELDSGPTDSIIVGMEKANISDGFVENEISWQNVSNGIGTISGEHPYGEHPSRTLFVRNINSSVEDSELRELFEPYGEIRSLYTACKHRGFVMISFYDIRSAKTAMRALQNKSLRRRRLDIHFSIPKENPSDKDMNQGTLVIFNLDPSVSTDDLLHIFGAYGEVKEIRETPNKRHHKFIEFYDVRAAEAALQSLNKCDIAGKRIKLEPSRPGGARKNLMQHATHDLEPDENRALNHQRSSPVSSFSGTWHQFKNPNDCSQIQSLGKYSAGGIMNLTGSNHLPGLTTMHNTFISNTTNVAPHGKDHKMDNYADRIFSGSNSPHEGGFHHSPLVLDYNSRTMASSPGTLSSLGSTSNGYGLGASTRPQFLWGSPTSNMDHSQSSSWHSQVVGPSFPFNERQQGQSFPHSSYHGSLVGLSYSQHQVGSAPPDAPFKRHYSYFPEMQETSFMNQAASGNARISQNNGAIRGPGIDVFANIEDNGSTKPRMTPCQRSPPTFLDNNQNPVLSSSSLQGLMHQGFSGQFDIRGSQEDNKMQYYLDLDKICTGEDTRTTLMIKNIPNKYNSKFYLNSASFFSLMKFIYYFFFSSRYTLKMLLAAIDENHKGTYDFIYLPIDFKNKCNVGYAFINLVSPSQIISFYKTFNGKKWEKFNSEKVASLAYAKIQGKPALRAHFENSSLMNEENRCMPIIFGSEGSHADDQRLFSLDGMKNTNMHTKDGDHFSKRRI